MSTNKPDPLSSRSLLARIGLDDEHAMNFLLDEEFGEAPMEALLQALTDRYNALQQSHDFKPGDLVGWKPGLRNRRFPRQDRPAVVLEVLASPIFDNEADAGSTYFREPLDIVLGVFLDEGEHRGDFMRWYFDSRRLRPWGRGA